MTATTDSNGAGRLLRPRILRLALAVMLAGSALWATSLLGSHVQAPTASPDRDDCGASALSINSEGSSIGGGELRVDQDAFDQACVDRARERIRLSLVPVSILAVTLMGVLLDRRRRRALRQTGADRSVLD